MQPERSSDRPAQIVFYFFSYLVYVLLLIIGDHPESELFWYMHGEGSSESALDYYGLPPKVQIFPIDLDHRHPSIIRYPPDAS